MRKTTWVRVMNVQGMISPTMAKQTRIDSHESDQGEEAPILSLEQAAAKPRVGKNNRNL
jgi:hypothetical protein